MASQFFHCLLALLHGLETFVSEFNHFNLRGGGFDLWTNRRSRWGRAFPDFYIGLAGWARGCPSATHLTRKQHAERPSPVHILIISELLEERVTTCAGDTHCRSTGSSLASDRNTPDTYPGPVGTVDTPGISSNAFPRPRRPRTNRWPSGDYPRW